MRFKTACVLSALLLLLPNFFNRHLVPLSTAGKPGERFVPALVDQLRTVDALCTAAETNAATQDPVIPFKLRYADNVSELLKDRFYHGYSHYSLQDNWLAALCGRFCWYDLSAIVLPDDILKYPMAACSQQSIVFMECLKREGIPYRKVGFDHHFALEAEIGGQWFYFDPNMEPDWSGVKRTSIAQLRQTGLLYKIYRNRLDTAGVNFMLGHQYYGKPNETLALQASLFHKITKLLSHVAFIFPLLVCFGRRRRPVVPARPAVVTSLPPVIA